MNFKPKTANMDFFGHKKPAFFERLGLSDRQFDILKNISSYVASFLVLKHLLIGLFGNIVLIFASPIAGIFGIISTTFFITLTLVSLVYGFALSMKGLSRPNWMFYADLFSIVYFSILL